MYELETQAGMVFSLSESLADALAECIEAEHKSRTADFYQAIDTGLEAACEAPLAEVVPFRPVRVA